MRYSKRAILIAKGDMKNDPKQGKRVEIDAVEVIVACNVESLSIEKQNAFSSIVGGATHVIRTRSKVASVNEIRVGNKRFAIKRFVDHEQHGRVYYVSEVVRDER